MSLFTRVSKGYSQETESYYIYFDLLDCTVYYDVAWDDETNDFEHIISVYKNKKHQLGVSGSKAFVKEKFLNWVDLLCKKL